LLILLINNALIYYSRTYKYIIIVLLVSALVNPSNNYTKDNIDIDIDIDNTIF